MTPTTMIGGWRHERTDHRPHRIGHARPARQTGAGRPAGWLMGNEWSPLIHVPVTIHPDLTAIDPTATFNTGQRPDHGRGHPLLADQSNGLHQHRPRLYPRKQRLHAAPRHTPPERTRIIKERKNGMQQTEIAALTIVGGDLISQPLIPATIMAGAGGI